MTGFIHPHAASGHSLRYGASRPAALAAGRPDRATARTAALTALAYALHDFLGLQRARVRGVALRAEGLGPAERAARQAAFAPADEKGRRIEAVADRARAKFGPRAILPGSLAV